MRAPAIPSNEAERLADLHDYGILGAAAERVFDEIAALAAGICGTPYAALTLVDHERLWFKAAFGLALESSSRAESVCGHGILERDFFEVPDLQADDRFAGNPLLEGRRQLRFYGGAQLNSSNGNPIGMLCVMDSRPRELSASQRRWLQQLATLVMTLLESGRQTRLLNWFGALVDTISEEIFIADPQSLQYLYANASALRGLGYTLDQLRGMTVADVTHDPDRAALESYVARLRRGEADVVFDASRRRSSGEVYPVEVRWQLLSTRGQPVIMSIVQDVTQRKEMDRLKDEFISVVNHELRTPLTSIHGAVKLLQQGAGGTLPEAAMRLVTLAGDNTDRLRRIVDDILQLEQIASGRMEFRIEQLAAPAVLEQVAHGYEAAAHAAGVTLAVEAAAGLMLLADAQRLHQVLANLVSNAIKFAPRDSRVLLTASRVAEHRVRLGVTDGGEGIPEHFRSRIFQRFAQADMNSRRTKGGSGLGLSIAKQMTEHMGGAIGYESEPGHTFFHVDLPEVLP